MTNKEKLEKIKEKLLALNTEYVTIDDLYNFLGVVLNYIKDTNTSINKTTEENIKKIQDYAHYVTRETSKIANETDEKSQEIINEVKKLKKDVLNLIAEVESIEVKDGENGKDADYETFRDQILLEIPEYELKGSEVVEAINDLPIEEVYQIDAKHIKNLPQLNFNGGGLRNLYQMHDVALGELVTGDLLQWNGTAWTNTAFDNNGILSLNGLTGATQTFAVGTAGTDFDIDSTGSTHTFNLPTASATNRGALSSTDWSTFNGKQNAITGTDTQVLFFDGANNPAGHSGLTYDKTTGTLTIDNISSSLTNNFNLVADDGVFVTATGSNINLIANGYVRVKSGLASEFAQFDTLALTTSRNFAFQDVDGTLALLSDLTSFVTNVTASAPLSSSGGTTPNITISQAGAGTDGYLSSTDWNTFNDKEPAITAGTTSQYWRGDKTFQTLDTLAVPENSNLYFTEPRVLSTILNGLSVTGTNIVGTDTVLEAFGKAQNQINLLVGGVMFVSTWDANTNTPTLASGVGTKGHYYVVSTPGATNLDGITDWKLGDWAIYNGTAWEKVDNTDAVISVNGNVGAVSLTGTANRITVTGTQWDIAATYVGQTSITTLGTVTTGTWNGTAIANANLANSSLTIGSTNIALGATSLTLAGLTSVTATTFTGALTGNASTATALQTARTIGIATGDVTSSGSSFNGTANNTNAYTLATVNANVGSFGSATQVGVFTVNGKGLITAASNTTITPAVGSITGLGTGVSTALAVNVGTAGAFVVNGGALGTPSSGIVTNLTGTASININGTVGATTPTTATFTTATVNTGLMPDVNDGAYLGQAGTAFSDLFLAEGAVINWDNGDLTLTQSGNVLTLAGGDLTVPNITVSSLTAGSVLIAGTAGLVDDDNAELFFNTSTNMLGIGNASPQRKLHVTSSSALTTTIFALDNPNTTDGNGILQSFRTDTTGVGATSFVELGAIRTLVTTHNHATRASNFSFFNSIAGVLTESMKISETGDVSIGTTTALGRLSVRQNTLGSSVQALSSVATNDDPTELVYQNRVATTNATVTTLHTFTIPASTTYTVTSWVVARRTGGTGGTAEDGAAYTISATFKNVAGTATQIGATTVISTAEDQAAWDCTYDVTGATARVRVTGAANNNVSWHLTARVWAVST